MREGGRQGGGKGDRGREEGNRGYYVYTMLPW